MSQTLQSVLCITTNKYLVHVLVVLLHARFSVVGPIPFLLAAIFFSVHPYIGSTTVLPDSLLFIYCACISQWVVVSVPSSTFHIVNVFSINVLEFNFFIFFKIFCLLRLLCVRTQGIIAVILLHINFIILSRNFCIFVISVKIMFLTILLVRDYITVWNLINRTLCLLEFNFFIFCLYIFISSVFSFTME